MVAKLVDSLGESAHLAILHARDVVYVVEERAVGRQTLVTDVGVRLPAHLTATGRAMLAALPRAQVRALYSSVTAFADARSADGEPWTYRRLRRILDRVQEEGIARENGEITPGVASVGAPVLDHVGWPSAAMAVTFSADAEPDRVEAAVIAVRAAAATLSQRIGSGRVVP